MALRLVTGFEIGTTAGWATGNAGNKFVDLVGGSPALVTTTPRNGTYCLEISSSAADEYLLWTTDTLGTSQDRGACVFARHVQHSVEPVRFASEAQVGRGVGC
jgi:hypothetical protein